MRPEACNRPFPPRRLRALAVAAAALIVAGSGYAAPSYAAPGGGELSGGRYKADRPHTADVDGVSLRWQVSTVAGEPYVTYAVTWTIGARARGDGESVDLKSAARRKVKLARAAVLRARVVAPGCDRCAWLEFIVPEAIASGKESGEVSVSPPWNRLFLDASGRPGKFMSEPAAREVMAGAIDLADLQISEPRFDLGSAIPPKPVGCGRLYCD